MNGALGKIARRGNTYCGSGCGRGCTWAEYQRAVKAGAALAKRLGPKWQPVIHENLGWHYRVHYGAVALFVHERDKRCYWADLHVFNRQFEATATTPEKALVAVCSQIRHQLVILRTAYQIMEGL